MRSDTIPDMIPNSFVIKSSSNSNLDLFLNKKRKKKGRWKGYSAKEEAKILKYALKMSEKEYHQNIPNDVSGEHKLQFNEMEEVKIFHATEQDFTNPLKFFDNLWEENKASSGIIKIIPPSNWVAIQKELINKTYRPRLEENKKKLFVRKQDLNDLYLAKKFENTRDFNLEEYRKIGKEILNKLNYNEKQVDLQKIEEDYWKFCEDRKNHLTVYYASDISLQKYFSKKELFDLINDKKEDTLEEFNLLRVNVLKESMLQFTKQDSESQISGITIPWFYYGMLFSTFCWHTEDLYLYSLNYMHEGAAKIWYSISHTDKEKMDDYVKKKYYATLLKEPNLLHKLTVHVSPLELMKKGIKVYRVVQNPGELIITLPKGYHCGFSTGLNMAEAVNFSTLKWVNYGLKAQIDYKKNNRKMPVFSMEWIIMNNFENYILSKYDQKHYKKNIKAVVNHIITEEIDARLKIETFFITNKINYIIEVIENSDFKDTFECEMCTYYGFLSQLQCNNCKRKGCIAHSIQCKCLPTDFTFRYRYMINELKAIKSKKF